MSPNLTYPILINAPINPTINATLNAPSNFIKDWIPPITAIVVVIIGSYLTYVWAMKAEKQIRQYELKKDAYFSALTAIIDIRQIWEDLRKAKEQQPHTLRNHIIQDNTQLERKFNDLRNQLTLLQMKMDIVASDEINEIFDLILEKATRIEDFDVFRDAIFNRLVPAIRVDLLQTELQAKKSWWQFWK